MAFRSMWHTLKQRKNAWARIASSVRTWRYDLLGSERFMAGVRTLEAMRAQAFPNHGPNNYVLKFYPIDWGGE